MEVEDRSLTVAAPGSKLVSAFRFLDLLDEMRASVRFHPSATNAHQPDRDASNSQIIVKKNLPRRIPDIGCWCRQRIGLRIPQKKGADDLQVRGAGTLVSDAV